MTTAMYFIKRAICDRLTLETGPGQILDGVQVLYAFEGDITERCVYFGGTTFDQAGTEDVASGIDVLAYESDVIRLYVRVFKRGGTVRAAEQDAEAIGDELANLLGKDPRLAGPNTWTRIAGGTGDYQLTDDGPIVILAYRLTTTAYV